VIPADQEGGVATTRKYYDDWADEYQIRYPEEKGARGCVARQEERQGIVQKGVGQPQRGAQAAREN